MFCEKCGEKLNPDDFYGYICPNGCTDAEEEFSDDDLRDFYRDREARQLNREEYHGTRY